MPTVYSIDAHAAGEPCRVVYGGVPELRGRDMPERRRVFREEFDWIRSGLTLEPRGHSGMFGALLTSPVRPESAFGLIFFDPVGYMDGCGHGTLCSVAVWRRIRGRLSAPFQIDNPDGTVTRVVAADGDEENCTATIELPCASVLADPIQAPRAERLGAALATCSNTFAIVEASRAGVERLRRVPLSRVVQAARPIHEEMREAVDLPADRGLEVMLYERLDDADLAFRTAVVFNGTQVDRSPCGTGSCALAAVLVSRGVMRSGGSIRTVGLSGEAFQVRASATAEGSSVGHAYKVVLRGSAHITGVHQWIFSHADALCHGYALGGEG